MLSPHVRTPTHPHLKAHKQFKALATIQPCLRPQIPPNLEYGSKQLICEVHLAKFLDLEQLEDFSKQKPDAILKPLTNFHLLLSELPPCLLASYLSPPPYL